MPRGATEAHVPELSFIKVDDQAETYDVYCNGDHIGLIWEKDGRWFADPFRMSASAPEADDREAAARNLIALHDDHAPN